jgi:hypothetical protein
VHIMTACLPDCVVSECSLCSTCLKLLVARISETRVLLVVSIRLWLISASRLARSVASDIRQTSPTNCPDKVICLSENRWL